MLLRDLQMFDFRSGELGGHMSGFDTSIVHLVELYLQRLGRVIETDGIAKVIIGLIDRDGQPTDSRLGAVLLVEWPFDFEVHITLVEAEGKRLVLDVLHEALVHVARAHGWATDPLMSAHEGAVSGALVYTGMLLSEPARSPAQSWALNCQFCMTASTLNVDAVILDAEGRMRGQEHLYSTFVGYDRTRLLVKRIRWASEEVAEILPGEATDVQKHRVRKPAYLDR